MNQASHILVKRSHRASQRLRGFTLIEMLVVVAIVGVTAAIAAPSWLNFSEGNKLTTERDKIYSGLRSAQTSAQRESSTWQFSLRQQGDSIEWAVHPRSVPPLSAQWNTLDSQSVQIDEETTFATASGVYYVRFDEKGDVQYRLGRITLSSKRVPKLKRCVVVSTLIGAMRKSKEQSKPRAGKLCY